MLGQLVHFDKKTPNRILLFYNGHSCPSIRVIMVSKALFTSHKFDWETPDFIFQKLKQEFDFTYDLAANNKNTKCECYTNDFLEIKNLEKSPHEYFWLNPPYGRNIISFIQKAYELSCAGKTVVCLLPCRTDTRWWHEYAMKAEIRFVKGRIRFKGAKTSAPFPSVVLIFRNQKPAHNIKTYDKAFNLIGT